MSIATPTWSMKIVSSSLALAVYNVKEETMAIRFNNGSEYLYRYVDVDEFIEFTLAESQGKWFANHIKDIKPFDKVE
jgi:hypothetical protein